MKKVIDFFGGGFTIFAMEVYRNTGDSIPDSRQNSGDVRNGTSINDGGCSILMPLRSAHPFIFIR